MGGCNSTARNSLEQKILLALSVWLFTNRSAVFSTGLEQTHLLYVAYNIEGALLKNIYSLHSSHNMFNENMSYARAHAWYCYCDWSANSKWQKSFPPWVTFVRSLSFIEGSHQGQQTMSDHLCLICCVCGEFIYLMSGAHRGKATTFIAIYLANRCHH